MKKMIDALLNQKWTLLGMFAAWVCLEGSAKVTVTYAIGLVIVIDLIHELSKKDDND